MLLLQVINHGLHLAVVIVSLNWHSSEVKLLLGGLKAAVAVRDEICASVLVHRLLSLVLAMGVAAHWVKVCCCRRAVVDRLRAHGEV